MNLSACGSYVWNTRAGAAVERYAEQHGITMDEMREWFRMTPQGLWGDLIMYLERES